MSGFNIGVKEHEWADYIEKVYELMTDEDKETIVKCEIYACCKPSSEDEQVRYKKALTDNPDYQPTDGWNHDYEIDNFMRSMSNRVRYGPARHVVDAMVICLGLFPHTFLPMNDMQDYTCPCCGYKFRTRDKDPRCTFCGKFGWQKESEAKDDN